MFDIWGHGNRAVDRVDGHDLNYLCKRRGVFCRGIIDGRMLIDDRGYPGKDILDLLKGEGQMSWLAKKKEKRRMEKLYDQTKTWYGCGCYRNDKRGGTLTRWYPYSTNHKNNKKWWRRYSNRRFRRNETEILNGNIHKRSFDMWWTVY